MIYLLFVLWLTGAITGFAFFLRRCSSVQERRGLIVSWIIPQVLSILLVAIGVMWSFHMSEMKERAAAEKLFRLGHHNVYQTRQQLISLYHLMESDRFTGGNIAATLSDRTIPMPETFFRLVDTEKAWLVMNNEMMNSIDKFKQNTTLVSDLLRSDSVNDDLAMSYLYACGTQIWHIEQLAALFIEYLDEDWTDSTFSAKKQAQLKRYIRLGIRPPAAGSEQQHPWLELGP